MATYTDQLVVYSNGRLLKIASGDALVVNGAITATSFSGSGANLTGLSASHISTGTLSDDRLSSNVAKYDDATPTFDNTVTADGFSGSGAGLTNLSVAALVAATPGATISDALLASNILRKDAASNTLTGNLNVGGNLNVTGNIVSAGSASVIVKDAFLDLNAGNTVFGAQLAGGLAVNVESLTATPFTATDFVEGVASTSNPTVTVAEDASAAFAAGDLIQISGTTDAKNDGQFVVLSLSGSGPTVITVKGIGTSGTNAQTPFAHTQFVDQTSQVANLVKIRVSALSATNGVLANGGGALAVGGWCYASGDAESDFIGGWTNLDPTAGATLQNVYNNSLVGVIETYAAKGGFTVQPATGQSTGFELIADGAGQSGLLRAAGGSDMLVQSVGGGFVGLNSSTSLILEATTVIQVNGLIANAGANSGSLAQYTLVAYDSATGDLVPADADTADVVPAGVVYDDNNIYSTAGMRMKALGAAGTAWQPGATLYVSSEAGKVTDVPPTSGRVFVVGLATDAYTEGVDATAWIRWMPQYIADL